MKNLRQHALWNLRMEKECAAWFLDGNNTLKIVVIFAD